MKRGSDRDGEMMSDGALGLLLRICEAERPEILRQWIGVSGEDAAFETLSAIGVLRHAANASIVWCYACDETHEVTVELTSSGRLRAYCPDAGYQDVAARDLEIYSVDFLALGGLIRRGLGMSARKPIQELVPNRLW